MELEFSRQIFEKCSYIYIYIYIYIKYVIQIHPEGAELFYRDEQTDMTKLLVAFRNFANTLNNDVIYSPHECTRYKYSMRIGQYSSKHVRAFNNSKQQTLLELRTKWCCPCQKSNSGRPACSLIPILQYLDSPFKKRII